MIAVDTNILVYAHREDSEWHDSALGTIMGLAQGAAPWAIPWPCVHEFVAIVTHPKIYDPPTPLARTLDQVSAWMESPSLTVLSEGPGYWEILHSALTSARVVGPAAHDARIAALCFYHGVRELWSADRDFTRFPRLTVRNPLVRKR